MAVRLHMKLGIVAEHDRLADSPDTLVVVEPSVGSVARSKGHLYLLVTSRTSSRHALEATHVLMRRGTHGAKLLPGRAHVVTEITRTGHRSARWRARGAMVR